MVDISVVIPVYNERATIAALLSRVQATDLDKEIIIVDDGSTDGTREFLQEVAHTGTQQPAGLLLPNTGPWLRTDNIRVFFQPRNQGKGAALRTGFHNSKGEVVIVQDADLEYDPGDYRTLLEPVRRGVADVVYGSRFLGGPHRVMFFWHYAGNKFLTLLSNALSNLNLTDVWTCYKVFRMPVLRSIELREDRFGFEAEVTAKVAKGHWRVYEVPISYYGRTYSEGKKITWRDGLRGVWCSLRYNLFA
ncbi:MAG TPA: glycosyltransferase family 2 protein [Terriglobia bacterium]